MKKKILCTCLAALCCVNFVGCGAAETASDNTESSGAGLVKEVSTETEQTTENVATEPVAEDEVKSTYVDAECTTEDTLYPADAAAEAEGISYHVDALEITKEFGNRNFENLGDYIDIDENGNLLCDMTYYFLTITYTNNSEENIVFDRTAGGVVDITSNLEVLNYSEAVYIDEYWTGGDPTSVFFYELKPGESITSEVGYVVDDEREEGKLYLEVGHQSMETARYISLEE